MRKILSIIIVVAMILGLCGCSITYDNVTITKDTINEVFYVDIEKDYLDSLSKNPKYDTEVRASIIAMIAAMDTVEHDGVTYYRYKRTESNSFEDYMVDMNDNNTAYVSQDTYYLKTDVDAMGERILGYNGTIKKRESAQASYGGIDIDYSKVKLNESITFTNNIVKTNGTIDKNNSKKVNFSFDGSKDKSAVIFATTNKKYTIASIEKTIALSNKIGKPKIKKIKANKVKKKSKKASITVKIKKVKGAEEYCYEYSRDKKFNSSQSKYSKKSKIKINKLKKNKKYYVRVFALKTNYAGESIDSKYSKTKSIKTKK